MHGGSDPHPGFCSTTRDPRVPIQERPRNDPRPHLREGIPDTPAPDLTTFDRKRCSLILIEVGFSRDFGCHTKLREKTAKYAPLVIDLKALWGKVELVAVPIDHVGTTLNKTQESLAQALSATRPDVK